MAWYKCQNGKGIPPLPETLFDWSFQGAQYGSDRNESITLNTRNVKSVTFTVYGSTYARGTGNVYTNFYRFIFSVDGIERVSANEQFNVYSNEDDQPHSTSKSFTVTLTDADLPNGDCVFGFRAWYNPGGEWWDGTCSGSASVKISNIVYK